MLKATFKKHNLIFNIPGGTSRGVLTEKPSWYLRIENVQGNIGIGEISIIPNLSLDDVDKMDLTLNDVCSNIDNVVKDYHSRFERQPAVRFGIEMALKDMINSASHILFPSDFTQGMDSISINGLIWMGDLDFMNKQIESKLNQGFTCLKMKIGSIGFDDELSVLKNIRQRFSKDELELRVDANGAFETEEALNKLDLLSKYDLHSIEQPIKAGQWRDMADLCEKTPLPIALDEELIGINGSRKRAEMLSTILPQYIILKPSLTGGFKSSEDWISLAKERQIDWWITSALEGNIGLNAIAQWTYGLQSSLPQGLGTGQVFSNNVNSPLYLKGDQLFYDPHLEWENPFNINE